MNEPESIKINSQFEAENLPEGEMAWMTGYLAYLACWGLGQRPANHSLGAMFVNKVLPEHSHAHFLHDVCGFLRKSLKSLRHILSGSGQKRGFHP